MEDYYSDIINAIRMGEYLTRKEREVIDSFLEGKNIGTCLDAPCGSGRLSIPISQHGINVVAVDYDFVPLRKLKDKTNEKEKIMIIRGDINKLPLKESCFDYIMSIQGPDYAANIRFFFKQCNKILKKDGFLLFNMGNKHSYKRYIYRALSSSRTFYRYSFEEIRSYLRQEGFEVKRCMGYNWIPFKRDSNSVLIGPFEFWEKMLRLNHLPRISPWVFFVAKKKEE